MSAIVKIPLTRGLIALVDGIGIRQTEYRWHASVSGYALRRSPENWRVNWWMHRRIMEDLIGRPLAAHELVDHIDGDKTNNVCSNLRIASKAENVHNSKTPVTNTSGLKGASYHKATGKWRARIWADGMYIHLGLFETPEEAHAAYCAAAKQHFGSFARYK